MAVAYLWLIRRDEIELTALATRTENKPPTENPTVTDRRKAKRRLTTDRSRPRGASSASVNNIPMY